ncbi:carboxy terminal-processing peptidase [Flavobacterium sp. MFBS3-15]|uniref:carboxy terminal-processing peptidase n=1 Tax=Flavobacterium sp. MFBS3-15 TaxID=2989816 RepID=UPI002235A088|nr:carboxy terminal-processing peptidase [Flavobacterium sp. MFBS3-15]MCW4468714.1 carboxy terminal-processing peptidase [Flavobacterium sp. MFBS3-15]
MNAVIKFMKRNYKILLFVAILSVALWSFMPGTQKKSGDPDRDMVLLELLTYVIEKGHYDPAAIDDTFSKGVYKSYLEQIDPSKRFFTQSDIDEFSKYEDKIDDMILAKDLTFFDLTNTRLLERIKEAEGFYKEILAEPFDFKKDEQFSVDYEKMPYVKNDSELRERWEKQLKLSVLSTVTDKEKLQDEIAAKNTDKGKAFEPKKTFAELEKEARESTLKSLNDYFSFIKDFKRDEWFSIYLNAIAERFDPHTYYFAPDDKEKFDTSMRGSLEGIGARLQKKGDYIEISELIPGGPAWRGKDLEQGDLIMKVAQGTGDPVDIAGIRLDDVVKKIKGKKGTEVRLTVKKVDGSIKVISIIREVVEIEETYAKSSIVNKDGKLYGIINLPKFYIDFENKDSRDAAKDVALEVERLKQQGVEGIIMDLRDNGGGALRTVVDMAGLFIEDGPMVQVKSSGKKKEVLNDKDSRVQWDGPLVVLVNNFSASASEIFAAAIQDYNRGLILGSKHTYGKGTVQNIIDLNQFVRDDSFGDLGALKTTTQKYYRVNGGSVQREGVYSDIIMPDRFTYIDMGERDTDNAMPYDKIDPASYKPVRNNFAGVIAASKKRIAANPQFKLMDENAKWVNAKKDDNIFSLNAEKFKAEVAKNEVATKKFKALNDYKNSLKFESLPYEKEIFKKDPSLAEKKERWYESLSKDIYVEEALNILNDMQPKSSGKAAANVQKAPLQKTK